MSNALLLLLHKSLGLVVGALVSVGIVTSIDLGHTIGLGSVLLTFVILAIAGIFTVRSRIATIWREEAEGERAVKERLQKELTAERAAMAEFEKEQQEIRHALKNDVAALRNQIQILEAKTDLTSAVSEITTISQQSGQQVADQLISFMHEQVERSERRDHATFELLREIRDNLPRQTSKGDGDG